MIGIALTLLAVFFVICVAFYFTDFPGERIRGADPLFFINSACGKERRSHK